MKFNSVDLYDNLIGNNAYWVINKDDYMIIKEYLTIHFGQEISIQDLGPIGNDQYHYYQLAVASPIN
jgi:hypothetical protein